MVAWSEPVELSDVFVARSEESEPTIGEVYHVARNEHGGAMWTPVVRYFAWRPSPADGYHSHWRLECFVRDDELAPDPEWVGKALTDALVSQQVLSEPLWVSWHRSQELGGEERGEVFDQD
jgi:hypothetical protein